MSLNKPQIGELFKYKKFYIRITSVKEMKLKEEGHHYTYDIISKEKLDSLEYAFNFFTSSSAMHKELEECNETEKVLYGTD